MPDKKPSALSGEQKTAGAVSISVAVASVAGIAFSALTAVSCLAADGSALPLKSISLDAQKQLIVEFSTHGGGFPAVPHLLDLPGPNHRVVVDLAGATIEKGSLQTPEELSAAIGKAIPSIKGLRYYNQANTDKPTARIVLDLPEALRAEPRVVKLDENSVTIDLGSEITSANAGGSAPVALASADAAAAAPSTDAAPIAQAAEGSPMAQALAAAPSEVAPVSSIADTASAPTPFAAAEPTPVSSSSPAIGQDAASMAPVATAAVASAADTTDGVVKLKQPETVITNSPAGTSHEDWSDAGSSAMDSKAPAAVQPTAAVAPVAQAADSVDGLAPGAAATPRTVAQPVAAGDSPELRPAIGGAAVAPSAPDQPLGSSPTGNAITPPAPPEASATGVKAAVKLYNSAVRNHLAGKLSDAINDYKGAIAANPQLAEAHSNLGLIYNQQHNYAQALSEFRKALAINPKDAITYNGIGAALRAQKDLPGAIKNWQTAVSLDSHLATAHYNLGTAYEIQKDYDRALESYKEAVKNDYRLGEAYYRMGLIQQERKHQNAEALSQFREALKVSTDSEYSDDARSRVASLGKTTQTK